MRDAVRAFNVACIEQEGYEADDIIATYALQAVEAGAEVTIVSSDKDLMQLVQPGIIMYDTMKNKVIGEAEVIERFGVPPSKVVEVQALIGDSSDNVPGVPGIGVKTAALLINEFGDLETLLARASEIKQEKRRESLITFADQARLSKALVHSRHPCAARCRARRDRGARSPTPRRCSASCASSNSARWSAASPRVSAPRRPKGMTPSPTTAAARRRTTTIIRCGARRAARPGRRASRR